MHLSNDIMAMLKDWYGYGRWDAPYWFIGIEPGGDELEECLRDWQRAGRTGLIDIAKHSVGTRGKDWFGDTATLQPTWMKLIWLLLAFKDRPVSPSSTLEYQRFAFGREPGETAIIEISCYPSRSNDDENIPRELFRLKRAEYIAAKLRECKPRFVVLYSPDPRYREAWEVIAGGRLVRDEPIMVGETAVMMTYHTNGERSRQYWISRGRQLRSFLDNRELRSGG